MLLLYFLLAVFVLLTIGCVVTFVCAYEKDDEGLGTIWVILTVALIIVGFAIYARLEQIDNVDKTEIQKRGAQ